MSVALAVSPAEAIAFIAFIAGWDGGVFPIYLDGRAEAYAPTKASGRLAKRVAEWDLRESRQVELGLPERSPNNGGPTGATVLWAWAESREQARRAAKRFRPAPSLVLKMGDSCRRLMLWALNERVPWVSLENSNKRIAYAIHAPQKYAQPEKLRIPMPGTFLRVGRARPAPVLVTRLEADVYARSQVVAGLKDPPPPYAQRMRERGLWA